MVTTMLYKRKMCKVKGSETEGCLKNQRGLTLIDILGALAVLGIIMTAFITLSQYVTKADVKTERHTRALLLAEKTMQEQRSELENQSPIPMAGSIYETWSEEPFIITIQDLPMGNTTQTDYTVPALDNHYSVQTVILLLNGGMAEPRLLTVTISWEETGGP